MITQQCRLGMTILALSMILLPAIGVSQSGDRDLGIVRLRYVTIVVRDYDEALKWYTSFLEIAKPYTASDKGINMSAVTANDSILNYEARVGTETRWVFEVEDCHKFYDIASKRGVKFIETPVDQPWGVSEAMFEDLYGNLFVVESFRPKPNAAVQ